MGYYSAGVALTRRRASDYTTGVSVGLLPGFVGTDEALRELTLLNSEINGAGRELSNVVGDKPLTDALSSWYARGGWQMFVKRWNSFYSDNKGWVARFFSPRDIFNKVQDFRREYIALREYASEKLGMEWGSVEPRRALEAPSITGDVGRVLGIGQLMKYIAIGLLLFGGFAFVLALVR